MALHAFHYRLQSCLDYYATHHHLPKRSVQGLEIEDQIKFTHVLEESIKGLDKDLYEVKECQRGLGRRADKDEVKGGVVTIGYERWSIIVCGARANLSIGRRRRGGKERRKSRDGT